MFENSQNEIFIDDELTAQEETKKPNALQEAVYGSPRDTVKSKPLLAFLDFQEKAKVNPVEVNQQGQNIDGAERIRLLSEDAKKGVWSDNGKKIWSDIFKEARENLPGANANDMLSELQVATVREINRRLLADGSEHSLQLAAANSRNNKDEIISTRYFALIIGGKIDQKPNIEAMRRGQGTDSSQLVGMIDWAADQEAFEKYKNDRVDILKKEALQNGWTDTSKKAWKELFNAMDNRPDNSNVKMKEDLTKITSDINDSLRAAESKNRVGLAAGLSPRQDEIEYYLLLNNDKVTAEDNADAIRQGIEKSTYTMIGSMNIAADGNASQKDDLVRGRLLAEEAATGAWSNKSQDTWRRTFNKLSTRANTTPDSMKATLDRYVDQVNRYLEIKNSQNKASVETRRENDEIKFFIQLQKRANGLPLNQNENEDALKKDRNTPTSIKAGSMKIPPPRGDRRV